MKHIRIEHLAYWLWQQRGMPVGSPDEDWFLAERLVGMRQGQSHPRPDIPLFAFGIERRTQ